MGGGSESFPLFLCLKIFLFGINYYLCCGNEAKLNSQVMITKETLKYFVETIDPETMQTELDRASDFVLLQAHYFNVGSFATIESRDYDYETDQEAAASGDLFCDKDEFLRLCDELEIFEY